MTENFAIYTNPAARVGVFIDAQNIFRSLQQLQFRKKLDYKKTLSKILAGRTLYCARFYDIIAEEDFSKDAFHQAIKRANYEILTKPVQVFAGGVTKGDWDLGMAIDIVSIAEKLDVVILGSGDGDFLPLVRYLKNKTRCRVEGLSFLRTTNSVLLGEFDSHIDLAGTGNADLYRP